MLFGAFFAFFVGYVLAVNVGTWWLISTSIVAFVGIQHTVWFRRQEIIGLVYMAWMVCLLAGEAIGMVVYWSKYPDQFSSLFQTTLKFLLP
jgi:hypothetical protein